MMKILMGLLVGLLPLFAGAWDNALKPAGEGVELELVRDGKACFSIDDNAVLKQGLKIATGVEFSSGEMPRIQLKSGGESTDDYSIAFEDGNLILSGNIANAVAALLEEDLGVRFYSPKTGMEFPAGKRITSAKIVPRNGLTPFRQRYPYFARTTDPTWAQFNRVRPGKFCGNWGTHSFQWLMPNEPWFRTHPEFFALHNGKRIPGGNLSGKGQLCMTNPEMIRQLTANALEKLSKDPNCEYLAVSQNDFSIWCSCPACTKLFQAEGSQAGPLLYAVNRVADEIHKTYPKVKIITEGYIETRKVPKTIRPSENVLFRMCLSDRIGRTQYVPTEQTEEGKYLVQWAKNVDELFVWDYCVDFADYLPPCPDFPVLDANIDFYRKNKVTGILNLGNFSTSNTAQQQMRAWVLAKKMWNPDWKMTDLVKDFNYGHFGAGAGPFMQQYSELLDTEWRNWYGKRTSERFVWSKDFLPQASDIFKQALAAADNDEYRGRVEREFIAVEYLRLLTVGGEKEDVDLWAEQCKRYDIVKINESGLTVTQILPRLYNKKREAALMKVAPRNTLYLLPATRAFIEHGAVMKDDPAATLGMAASSAGDSSKWGIHFHLDDFPEIDLRKNYRVMLLVRADMKSGQGEAMKTTWWNHLSDKRPGKSRNINASELSSTEYRWIDCGTIKPEDPGVYLLFSSLANGAIDRLYVQAVALTRP